MMVCVNLNFFLEEWDPIHLLKSVLFTIFTYIKECLCVNLSVSKYEQTVNRQTHRHTDTLTDATRAPGVQQGYFASFNCWMVYSEFCLILGYRESQEKSQMSLRSIRGSALLCADQVLRHSSKVGAD
jgi:hypothetical protein